MVSGDWLCLPLATAILGEHKVLGLPATDDGDYLLLTTHYLLTAILGEHKVLGLPSTDDGDT